MGFGILFVGYIFTIFDIGTMYSDSLSAVFMLVLRQIGWCIVFLGCHKLGETVKGFARAKAYALMLAAVSYSDLVLHMLARSGITGGGSLTVLRAAVLILLALLYGVFSYYLMKALCDITQETGLDKTLKKARRNTKITLVFVCVNLLSSLQISGLSAYLSPLRYLFYVALVILNSILIFSCYMWICMPEDVELNPRERKKRVKKGDGD